MTDRTTHPAKADPMLREWHRFAAFVRHPHLPDQTSSVWDSLKAVGRMLVLDLGLMACFLAVVVGAEALGLELPANILEDLEITPAVIAIIVIGAPIIEEILFRGWLSGRPGAVGALVIVITGLIVANLAFSLSANDLTRAIIVLVTIIAALICLLVLRKRPPMQWFIYLLPAMFWLSAAAFAAVHLLNYKEGQLAILFLLILPQFTMGIIAGYIRISYSLWASILLHAAHNGVAIAILLLAGPQGG